MATKFRRLAGKALPRNKIDDIEKIIWRLEREQSVAQLIAALRVE
jgi:hypothetical protein